MSLLEFVGFVALTLVGAAVLFLLSAVGAEYGVSCAFKRWDAKLDEKLAALDPEPDPDTEGETEDE